MQMQLLGFISQKIFSKCPLKSDEPGAQREPGWLHPSYILAKEDKIIIAWRSFYCIDKWCGEQQLMSFQWRSAHQKVSLMSPAMAWKTQTRTKGFCQCTGSVVHALSAKVFVFWYGLTRFPKNRMQKRDCFISRCLLAGREPEQRRHKAQASLLA